MRIAGLVAAVILIVMGVGSFGYVYNYHLAPLARLSNEITEGDRFSDVNGKFIAYYERRRSTGSVHFRARDSASGQWTTDVAVSANGLYLSDRGLFDDIQLTVEFDAGGRVEHIDLVGD